MTEDNLTGPELFKSANDELMNAFMQEGNDNKALGVAFAAVGAIQAQTGALVMLTEAICKAIGTNHYDLDAWREVIPVAPLRNCRSMYIRRPQCKDQHTADCDYAEPAPEPKEGPDCSEVADCDGRCCKRNEPKHELLPVGTYVLVSPPPTQCADGVERQTLNPYSAVVRGYDIGRTKYRLSPETTPGAFTQGLGHLWEFADNRVQVHPDGPECPLEPKPVKREPTGLRVYVEREDGLQGHIVSAHTSENDTCWVGVYWYAPGRGETSVLADTVKIIPASQVERCPNGQTRDECEMGENQCEPCLQDEDEEAAVIEESMGLR